MRSNQQKKSKRNTVHIHYFSIRTRQIFMAIATFNLNLMLAGDIMR